MAWQRWFFWDGRADSLWAQALGPIENPKEHGISRTRCAQLVSEHYWDAYERAIGRLPDVDFSALSPLARPSAKDKPAAEAWEAMSEKQRGQITEIYVNTGKALAAFVRTLKPAPAPFDHYARALATGDERGIKSLTEPQKKGLRLFIGKGKCINCHNGPLFSNGEFHHVGVPDKKTERSDRGRGAVIDSLAEAEFGYFSRWSDADPQKHGAHVRFLNADPGKFQRAFKTPGLRNVADRPPYMHAGQFATLSDLLKHYQNVAGKQLVDEIFHGDLSDEELGQLQTFLYALSAPKGDH
jgi:cytochrome c peroxidase